MAATTLIGAIVREVYEYQARSGGRSPAGMRVPESIMDILKIEANDVRSYVDDATLAGEMQICGVPVEADPAMRIAFMTDEEKTFSLPPHDPRR